MSVALTARSVWRNMALVVLLLAATFTACTSAKSLPTVSITLTSPSGQRSESFSMEVAATPNARSTGLMFRRTLGSQEGMLFLFPEQQQLSFWMKNTFIPLDMIFVSKDWKVVGILENVPPLTETPRRVDAESQYVLEFAAGTAKRIGILEGSLVEVAGTLPPVL
jgi:uncharacterized membrane protein (UPF0127 family)